MAKQRGAVNGYFHPEDGSGPGYPAAHVTSPFTIVPAAQNWKIRVVKVTVTSGKKHTVPACSPD